MNAWIIVGLSVGVVLASGVAVLAWQVIRLNAEVEALRHRAKSMNGLLGTISGYQDASEAWAKQVTKALSDIAAILEDI